MKALINFFPLIIFLMSSSHIVMGQSIASDTIEWNAFGYIDRTQDSTAAQISASITTFGNNRIVWTLTMTDISNIKSAKTRVLNVTGTTGEWIDLNEDGNIKFSAESSNEQGSINFKKQGPVRSIHIEIINESGLKLKYDFEVANFKKK